MAGLLVSGFHLPQTVLTNHNPPYYLELFERQEYQRQYKTYTFCFTHESVSQRVVKPCGFITREFNRSNWSGELLIFNKLQNMIFAGRNGYVTRTLEEDQEMLRDYLPYLDHELIIIAETPTGDPVGLLVCLPDLNQALKGREINRARIISIGVIPGLQGKGIGGRWLLTWQIISLRRGTKPPKLLGLWSITFRRRDWPGGLTPYRAGNLSCFVKTWETEEGQPVIRIMLQEDVTNGNKVVSIIIDLLKNNYTFAVSRLDCCSVKGVL